MKFCSINVNIFLARFVYCSMEKVFRVWRNFYIIVLYHIGCFYIKQLGNVFGIYVSIILKEDLLYTNVSIMNNEVFHFHFFIQKLLFWEESITQKLFYFKWMDDDFCPTLTDDIMWWLFGVWYIGIYIGERCLFL